MCSNSTVPLYNPLNSRQLDVLRWIQAGCPERASKDFTCEYMAIALQSRRLVEVSKRGGAWKAAILPHGGGFRRSVTYPKTGLLSSRQVFRPCSSRFMRPRHGNQDAGDLHAAVR